MKRFTTYIILLMVLLTGVGCSHEEEVRMEMPFSLCLPANEIYSASQAPRRAKGDPGTSEQFALPHYLYIIVLKKDGDDWIKWHVIEETVADEDWMLTTYNGTMYTQGNLVYQYKGQFNLLLSGQEFEGRVYAMASAVALSLSQDFSTISNLDELLALTFDASSNTIQENLQNIYSTPYNYEVSGNYYCSFNSADQRVPHVSLLLYHIAAKVDITWSVAEEMRIKANPAEAVRLTYMEARRLFNGNAYCFKPMRNEVAELPTEGGYTIADMVTATDEGLWWEGRRYFYTIPYTVTGNPDYFPLQMQLCTNGTNKAYAYKPTLNMQIDTSAVFVPWLRANFNISAPFVDKSETKTVNY